MNDQNPVEDSRQPQREIHDRLHAAGCDHLCPPQEPGTNTGTNHVWIGGTNDGRAGENINEINGRGDRI